MLPPCAAASNTNLYSMRKDAESFLLFHAVIILGKICYGKPNELSRQHFAINMADTSLPDFQPISGIDSRALPA